jgi:hypothetical protein
MVSAEQTEHFKQVLTIHIAETADQAAAGYERQSLDQKATAGRQAIRTRDLCRVNFEVSNLKPFPYLAFPQMIGLKMGPKQASFDGELMASFSASCRAPHPNCL